MNPMKQGPHVAGRPVCILVVDDERDNRELLEVILAWEGFVVLSAASGEEAISAVARELPHLILLDVMMPGMNGYQVTAKLKSELATKNVPIIIVTAMTDKASKALSEHSGADDFLAKPVDRDQLVVQIRALLRKTYLEYRDS